MNTDYLAIATQALGMGVEEPEKLRGDKGQMYRRPWNQEKDGLREQEVSGALRRQSLESLSKWGEDQATLFWCLFCVCFEIPLSLKFLWFLIGDFVLPFASALFQRVF